MAYFIFIVGILSFIGAESYQDFYLELSTKLRGGQIDYSKLSDFCGWTGAKYPWESSWEYDWRRVKNMFSALCAMLALSNLIVGSIVVMFLGFFMGKVDINEN